MPAKGNHLRCTGTTGNRTTRVAASLRAAGRYRRERPDAAALFPTQLCLRHGKMRVFDPLPRTDDRASRAAPRRSSTSGGTMDRTDQAGATIADGATGSVVTSNDGIGSVVD